MGCNCHLLEALDEPSNQDYRSDVDGVRMVLRSFDRNRGLLQSNWKVWNWTSPDWLGKTEVAARFPIPERDLCSNHQ